MDFFQNPIVKCLLSWLSRYFADLTGFPGQVMNNAKSYIIVMCALQCLQETNGNITYPAMDDVIKTFHSTGLYQRKTFLEVQKQHGEQMFGYIKRLFNEEPDNILQQLSIGAPVRFELRNPESPRRRSSELNPNVSIKITPQMSPPFLILRPDDGSRVSICNYPGSEVCRIVGSVLWHCGLPYRKAEHSWRCKVRERGLTIRVAKRNIVSEFRGHKNVPHKM